MTSSLTVRTRYSDVGELVMHLAARLEDEMLVIAAASRMPKGDYLKFIVALSDGTPVLEGVGRVFGWRERGKGAKLHERFDLQLDTLQFDEKNEVMWERILLARDTDRSTGEVDIEKLQREHDAAEATAHDIQSPPPLPGRAPAPSAPPPPPRASAAPPPPPPPARPSVPPAGTGDMTDPSLKLPPDLAARIAALVPKLEPVGPSLSVDSVSAESVTRLALQIGIAALEAQYR